MAFRTDEEQPFRVMITARDVISAKLQPPGLIRQYNSFWMNVMKPYVRY